MNVREVVRRRPPGGSWREYSVSFAIDPPERAEAVSFFKSGKHRLAQGDSVPVELDAMSEPDAQRYLDEHALRRRWEILFFDGSDGCVDADLARVRHIPELRIVRIVSDRITDAGVRSLGFLRSLEVLSIYSKSITDACLEDISQLRSLRSIDLQSSPNISQEGFRALLRRLPHIVDSYPPTK